MLCGVLVLLRPSARPAAALLRRCVPRDRFPPFFARPQKKFEFALQQAIEPVSALWLRQCVSKKTILPIEDYPIGVETVEEEPVRTAAQGSSATASLC